MMPEMMLKSVVLPAPFSPTIPTIWLRAAERLTESSVATPAKLLLTFSTSRIAFPVMMEGGRRASRTGSAADRPEAGSLPMVRSAAIPTRSGLLHRRGAEEVDLVMRLVLLLDRLGLAIGMGVAIGRGIIPAIG